MKEYRAVEAQLYWHLTSALNRGEWPVSSPDCFTLGKMVPHAPQPVWMHQRRKNVFPMPGIEHLEQWWSRIDSSPLLVHLWCVCVTSMCTVTTYFLQSFTKSSIQMKCHYKVQTIFDTHTCTALCLKLFYPLSTAVNVLPFQLFTTYSSSDIPHIISALTTEVAACMETQITVRRNRTNTHCICVSVFTCIMHKNRSQVVSIWAGWSMAHSHQRQEMLFLSSKTSRTALAPTQGTTCSYLWGTAQRAYSWSLTRWVSGAMHPLLL